VVGLTVIYDISDRRMGTTLRDETTISYARDATGGIARFPVAFGTDGCEGGRGYVPDPVSFRVLRPRSRLECAR